MEKQLSFPRSQNNFLHGTAFGRAKNVKNLEQKPAFLLMNFNWLLIFLIPDKQHCCLDNGSRDHGGNWLG